MEITNQPDAWTFAGWTEETIDEVVHAYVFYAGNLHDAENQSISFDLELKFIPKENYTLTHINGDELDSPIESDDSHTENLEVSASTSPSIRYTIADSGEEESEGEIHFLPVHVMEVSFGGDAYHELKSDDLATTYEAPQWIDNDGSGPTQNHSVAYTKKTSPAIGAKFKIKGLPANSEINVRAIWEGKDLLGDENGVQGDVDGEHLVIPITEAEEEEEEESVFPDKIKFYQKNEESAFKIQWQFSLAGDNNWGDVGTTKHQVYVTRTAPAESITHNRETLFYLACNKAAEDGLDGSNLLSLTNSIYKNFQSLEISSVDPATGKPDGNFLKFWGPGAAPDHILVDKTGVCGGWSDFLIEVLSIHRISANKVDIECKKNQKSWNTNVADLDKKAFRFFVRPCAVPQSAVYSEEWENALPNVPAQGHNTPHKAWLNHTIVQLEIENDLWYYDPSYGTGSFKGLLKYNDSLAGFTDLDGTWLWQPDGIHSDIKIK